MDMGVDMNCLHCIQLDLKANPKHAQVGFGHCQLQTVGAFVSFNHLPCEKFKEAPADTVEKRIQFDKSLTTKEK